MKLRGLRLPIRMRGGQLPATMFVVRSDNGVKHIMMMRVMVEAPDAEVLYVVRIYLKKKTIDNMLML